MFAKRNKWCQGWRSPFRIGHPPQFYLLVLSLIGLALIGLAHAQTNGGNGTAESGEYYYYDDNDLGNGTSKFSSSDNRTIGSDEYYYLEEVILRPKNGTGERLISSKVLQRNPSGKSSRRRFKDKEDSVKSESFIGGQHEVYEDIPPVPPSPEPLKEFVTQFDLIGPEYTDRNFGAFEVPGNNFEDVPLSDPLGAPFGEESGELQQNPYDTGQIDADLLRPPPPPPTEPPENAVSGPGLGFGEMEDVHYVEGIGLVHHGMEESGPVDLNGQRVPQKQTHHHLISEEESPNKLKIETEITLDAFGWAPSRNPIVSAKESFYHLVASMLGTTKTDVILWVEKLFNTLAELSIPKEHYLRVISFAGIYLFISVLAYGSENLAQIQCAVESKDKPLKTWKYHAGRRFVPARSVDPHMQDKFLDLFRGIDDDDDNSDEFSDLSKSLSSSEEDLADELDHISELCPKEAFYYSLNPRHIEAYAALKRLFLAQNSAAEVLSLAKYLLVKEKVHPKVWYFGLIGASLARTDMTGFSMVHPLDAIPDWYIPADLIPDKMLKYRRSRSQIQNQSHNITRVKRYTVTHSQSRNTTIIKNKPFKYYHIKKKIKNGSTKENDDKSRAPNAQAKIPPVAVGVVAAVRGNVTTLATPANYTVTVITASKNITVSKPSTTTNISKKGTSTTTTASPVSLSTPTVKTSKATTSSISTTSTSIPPTSISSSVTATSNSITSKLRPAKPPPKNKIIKTSTYIIKKPTKKPEQNSIIPQPSSLHPQQNIGGSKGDKGVLPVHGIKQRNKKKHFQKSGPGPNFELDDDRNHHHHHHRHKKKKKGKKKKGKKKKKECITVDWRVGLDNGIENELWYWREDMMLNQHHWYWHQTHPQNSTQHGDRRAELFVFMHREFIARYNAERLSNGMQMVTPLQFRPGGIIHEGYNSHMADINSGVYWTPRWPETPLADVFHDHDPDFAQNITLGGYLRNYWSLVKAIKTGKLFSQYGDFVPIDHLRGIEPLANTVEASDLSVNPMYYSPMGIHAMGHILVGLAADPDYRFRRVTGIMSDAALSMRDPSFYSYHLFLDNFFQLHKRQLAPYKAIGGDFPLLWKGVEVVKIELRSQGGAPVNELRTFWTHHKFELSPGVDRSIEKGEHAKICAQHLDHEPFHFKIVIDRKPCVKSKSGKATIRIFMAPRYDEKGRRIPVKSQRRLMFVLDSFPVKLKVGRNAITRYAEDSSLTQPWTKSLRDLERGPDPSGSADFCGCGFPQHLYIPKGHHAGLAFDLFVMVTNYDEDYVPNDPKLLEIPETCNSPYIFCGLPRRRYPDQRPMGYPFDRPLFKSLNCPPGWTFFSVVCKALSAVLYKPFDTLEQYVSKIPNMAMLKFHIKHLDIFLPEPARH